jgi:hypothetical protein
MLMFNPRFEFQVGRRLKFNYEYCYESLDVEGGRLYTAGISQADIIYQFNARAFLRSVLQYVDYDYNAELYIDPPDPEFKHLFSQLLFSYKLNPRTVLFLGYTDNYYGNQNYGVTQADRTFFIKLGYSWQL